MILKLFTKCDPVAHWKLKSHADALTSKARTKCNVSLSFQTSIVPNKWSGMKVTCTAQYS